MKPPTGAAKCWRYAGAVCAAVAMLVFGAQLLQAQTGTVQGTVTSAEGGEPIEGAEIEVGETEVRTLTDGAGEFSLRLEPGTHTLYFQALSHAPIERSVEVRAGVAISLSVALERRPIPIAPFTVLQDRIRMTGAEGRTGRIPGSAHFISEAELENQKLLSDDIHHMLRQVPGVVIQEEEGYGLRPNIGMRGTGSQRSSKITLLEDGILAAPAPYAAPAAYYFPIVGRMDGIEVRKGSSQIKYGPRTIGGALNLISSSIPSEFRLDGSVVGGSDATRKFTLELGDSHGAFGWLAETYQNRTDGFKRLDGGGNTGFDIEDYLLKMRVSGDTDSPVYHQLDLKLGATDQVSNETYLGLTDADFAADPFRRYAGSQRDLMTTDHRQYQVRYFLMPTAGVDLTTTLYRNEFARNWYKLADVNGTGLGTLLEDPGSFSEELAILRGADSDPGALRLRANNREYYSQGIESILGLGFRRLGGEHELELGIRFHRDQEDRFQHEDEYRMVEGAMELTAPGAPGSQSNRVSDAEAVAVFVRDEITIGGWQMVPGLRYESIDFVRTDYAGDDPERTSPVGVRENGVNALIPGIGVSRRLGGGLSAFGGLHRGFGAPGPGADAETEAESSTNYEAGLRYADGGWDAEVVGFFNDYENVLGKATLATGESGAGDLFNGGAVDVRGIEFLMKQDLGRSRGWSLGVPLHIAYTFTRAEFRTAFESDFGPWGTVSAGDRLPYLPEHQVHTSAGLADGGWRAELTLDYVAEMRTTAGQGTIPADQRIDDYVLLGLSGEYQVSGYGAVFAGVQNLTDQSYLAARRPAGARPGLPRSFMVGIRFGR